MRQLKEEGKGLGPPEKKKGPLIFQWPKTENEL